MKKIFFAIILVVATSVTAFAATPLENADSAYNKEDFKSAVRLYHQAIEQNGVSPEVYYNLGNSYYRIGRLGRAVIYYERALKLDPSFTDARTNLNFVNTKILDKPEDDSSFLGNLHNMILSIFRPNTWAWIAFGLFVVLLGAVALYIFSGNILLRKTGFFGGIVVLIIWIYAIVLASQSASAHYSHNEAVIIVPTANMTTSPGASTSKNAKVIPVHEGTKVEIIDSMAIPGDNSTPLWYDVKINNSTRAWVKSTDVEQI